MACFIILNHFSCFAAMHTVFPVCVCVCVWRLEIHFSGVQSIHPNKYAIKIQTKVAVNKGKKIK